MIEACEVLGLVPADTRNLYLDAFELVVEEFVRDHKGLRMFTSDGEVVTTAKTYKVTD